jgi:hypothetical protein
MTIMLSLTLNYGYEQLHERAAPVAAEASIVSMVCCSMMSYTQHVIEARDLGKVVIIFSCSSCSFEGILAHGSVSEVAEQYGSP